MRRNRIEFRSYYIGVDARKTPAPGRSGRIAAGLAACLAIGLSGCTFRPIDDPKYGRLDERNMFERAMTWDGDINELSGSLRATLARTLVADRSLAAHERALTALGMTCRYISRVLRCRYRRQVRWEAMLMPPKADQHEIQASVTIERGENRLAVCHGRTVIPSYVGKTGFSEDVEVSMSDCSPYTAISEPCTDPPRQEGTTLPGCKL